MASLTLSLVAVIAWEEMQDEQPDQQAAPTVTPTTTASPAPPSATSTPGIAEIYERVRPSVVLLSESASGRPTGAGSGVIIDSEAGFVLTARHVVQALGAIRVTLANGERALASVVGSDPANDLAVLQVHGLAGLQAATFGDSMNLRVGDGVLAIGNPFGLEGSLTLGVVSGIGRELPGRLGAPNLQRNLVQFDAAVNPGSSGGGLFDNSGRLVGIVTAIENPTNERVFVGVGYAVPFNTVVRHLGEMLAGKTVEHASLSILVGPVPPSVADAAGLRPAEGVQVTFVVPGSTADLAGLRENDIILRIDGVSIADADGMILVLDLRRPGQTVVLDVARRGARLALRAIVETAAE
jgi:S1-C subfamily serine protease